MSRLNSILSMEGMRMKVATVTLFLMFFSLNSYATDSINEFLSKSGLMKGVEASVFDTPLSEGLWNEKRTAFAFCFKIKRSACFVLIKRDSDVIVADVSPVEDGNFGKLGAKREDYDKFKTSVTKWLSREDEYYQVVFSTSAWKDGQRYTVKEPLVLNKEGEPHYR